MATDFDSTAARDRQHQRVSGHGRLGLGALRLPQPLPLPPPPAGFAFCTSHHTHKSSKRTSASRVTAPQAASAASGFIRTLHTFPPPPAQRVPLAPRGRGPRDGGRICAGCCSCARTLACQKCNACATCRTWLACSSSRPSSSSASYEAVYSPLVPTLEGGASGSISFVNEDLGLFWYQVEMSATPGLPRPAPPSPPPSCACYPQKPRSGP